MVPLICAALFMQTQAPAAPAPFSKPITVVEPNRLAMTPTIDGKISPEEWDPLTAGGDMKTYLDWEPGRIHLAARLPLGQDLVLSLDGENNGWLVGSDNLEVRVSYKDGKPSVAARGLAGGGEQGPHWFDVPGWEKAYVLSVSPETLYWTFELTLTDPGVDLLPTKPGTVGVRVDEMPSSAPPAEPYVPRTMAPVNFVFDRAAGLQTGVTWRPQIRYRNWVPGDTIRIRHTFLGNNDLKLRRFDMRTEGVSQDFTTSTGVPFPDFDRKNRAFIDYVSLLGRDIPLGWYVQRSTLTSADGATAIIQTSFRAATLLDIDMPKQTVNAVPKTTVQRFSVFLHSNSSRRLDGILVVTPPDGWRVMRGSDRSFIIPNSRGTVRRTFELEIPANVTGVFQINLRADIGDKTVVQPAWLNIVPKN